MQRFWESKKTKIVIALIALSLMCLSSVTHQSAASGVSTSPILYKTTTIHSSLLHLQTPLKSPLSSSASITSGIGSILVGAGPAGVTYDPNNQEAYVTNIFSNTTSVINKFNVVVATIGGFAEPTFSAFDPSNNQLFVANTGNQSVSVINTTSNTILGKPIELPVSPEFPVYDPFNGAIYVGDFNSGNVSVINGQTDSFLLQISLGKGSTAGALAYDPVNNNIYVDANSTDIAMINSRTAQLNFFGGFDQPTGFVYDPSNHELYVTNTGNGSVTALDAETSGALGTITTYSAFLGAYDPVNKYVYFSGGYTSNSTSMLNGTNNALAAEVLGFNEPEQIAYDSATKEMLVPNVLGFTVEVLSAQSFDLKGIVSVGQASGPTGIVYASTDREMYVADSASDTVSAYTSTGALVSTISGFNNPGSMTFVSTNKEVYVINQGNSTVSAINTAMNTVSGTPIPVGNGANSTVYDPASNSVYVSNQLEDSITIISTATNTVTTTLFGFNSPSGLAYDSANKMVYVGNYGNGTVSRISGATNTIKGSAIAVGGTPEELAYDSNDQDIYVTTGGPGVVVINGFENIVSAVLPVSPVYGVTYDPADQDIVLTDQQGALVFLNGLTVNGQFNYIAVTFVNDTISTPYPLQIAYDGASHAVWTADYGTGQASIIGS